jgi:hypothetical protein
MAAPVGNQFWKARSSHGRKPIFGSPDELWEACCEYFEWVEANPLYEAKAFASQGIVTTAELPKMRAMTLQGLFLFLDISAQAWTEYRTREGFTEITKQIDDTIRTQKFAGAAAGLLNASIIARDLGLADRQELSGPDGKPIETKDVSARSILADRVAGLAKRTGPDEGSGGADGSAG